MTELTSDSVGDMIADLTSSIITEREEATIVCGAREYFVVSASTAPEFPGFIMCELRDGSHVTMLARAVDAIIEKRPHGGMPVL